MPETMTPDFADLAQKANKAGIYTNYMQSLLGSAQTMPAGSMPMPLPAAPDEELAQAATDAQARIAAAPKTEALKLAVLAAPKAKAAIDEFVAAATAGAAPAGG